MNFEILTTERLLLRKLTPEVYRYVFNHYSKEKIMEFFGITAAADFLKEKERNEKGCESYNRSMVWFQLIEKKSQYIIGACGFHTWYLEHKRAELGYLITKDGYKEKGLMTEALNTVISYGFNTMHLHRIEAMVGPDNIASMKLMEKYHFQREGLLRQHYYKNDRFEDSVVFSLLREAFLKMQS